MERSSSGRGRAHATMARPRLTPAATKTVKTTPARETGPSSGAALLLLVEEEEDEEPVALGDEPPEPLLEDEAPLLPDEPVDEAEEDEEEEVEVGLVKSSVKMAALDSIVHDDVAGIAAVYGIDVMGPSDSGGWDQVEVTPFET